MIDRKKRASKRWLILITLLWVLKTFNGNKNMPMHDLFVLWGVWVGRGKKKKERKRAGKVSKGEALDYKIGGVGNLSRRCVVIQHTHTRIVYKVEITVGAWAVKCFACTCGLL